MRVIFVDIDGVLNYEGSISRNKTYLGIDNKRLKYLKEIAFTTGAKIVLTSSWREYYDIEKGWRQPHPNGRYLYKKFNKMHLRIYGKTRMDIPWNYRGTQIKFWLDTHDVSNYVILDDELFEDYYKLNLMPHVIKTIYRTDEDKWGGLTPNLVEEAIKILKGDLPEEGPTLDKDFKDYWFFGKEINKGDLFRV